MLSPDVEQARTPLLPLYSEFATHCFDNEHPDVFILHCSTTYGLNSLRIGFDVFFVHCMVLSLRSSAFHIVG
jgi:hypothetical protein